jgi:gamma-glutamylcysteine synthetase
MHITEHIVIDTTNIEVDHFENRLELIVPTTQMPDEIFDAIELITESIDSELISNALYEQIKNAVFEAHKMDFLHKRTR